MILSIFKYLPFFKCSTSYEEQCSTSYETSYEEKCSTTYKEVCRFLRKILTPLFQQKNSRFVPLAMADTVDMESNVRKFPRRAVSKSQFRSLWASVNRSQKNLVHRWALTWSTSFFVYTHTFLLGPSPETCSELSADSKRELQADPSAELSPDSCQKGDEGCQTSLWQTRIPLIGRNSKMKPLLI